MQPKSSSQIVGFLGHHLNYVKTNGNKITVCWRQLAKSRRAEGERERERDIRIVGGREEEVVNQ